MDEQVEDLDGAQHRAAAFGRLPARIHPSAAVEMVATGPVPGRPEAAETEDQRQAFHAGG